MKKTLLFGLLSTLLSAPLQVVMANHGNFHSKMKVQVPEVEFLGGISVPITRTCIEDGHIRAKKEFQPRHTPLVRPLFQIVTYKMGHGRSFDLVHRISTRGQLIQTFDMSHAEGRLVSQQFFDVPNCEDKLISTKHDMFIERVPSPQEMMVLAALFQRGITHAETQSYLVQKPAYQLMNTSYHDIHHQYDHHKLEIKVHSHQCQNGLIELTPEFLRYLQSPYGQVLYPTIDESFRLYQEYTEKYFNRIWNNHLRQRSLYQVIGGEGSGSGRIGFGLAMGGEGSGSGRRLEDLSTNSLALERGGEVVIHINMDSLHFHGLSYTQNILQRLFNINKEYMPYLNGGALIPSSLINVDCKR